MIHKSPILLHADPRRVVLQPLILPGTDRINRILDRVEKCPDQEVENMLASANQKFGRRHKDLQRLFSRHYELLASSYAEGRKLSGSRQLLAGALLSKEYSTEAAALFNPSMVSHPDQSGLDKGQMRFLMSLRAVGEGHVSSIVFRTGILNPDGTVMLTPLTPWQVLGEYTPDAPDSNEYNLSFSADSLIEERVIFPSTAIESMGMEDLRLVKFNDEEGTRYFGTYTAYDGRKIQSRLLETVDFRSFRIRSLTGPSATDKGMGLFPEKIGGKYAIISRQGGENVYIMFSGDLYRWESHELLMEPTYPFEMLQIGNCGSPIRTGKGWLLLMHGVGMVREYFFSAALLDLEDPSRVIARLDHPLIAPEEGQREGYVPNVVYTCGALIHAGKLFIPYAMSDSRCGFAWIELDELLHMLLK